MPIRAHWIKLNVTGIVSQEYWKLTFAHLITYITYSSLVIFNNGEYIFD